MDPNDKTERLLLVPPVLWGAMLLSVGGMAFLGVWFRGSAPSGASLVPFLLPLSALLALVGGAFVWWVTAQMTDANIFPRVKDAQARLGGEEPGEALLQLRLTLQVMGWAVADLVAFLGALLSLISGAGVYALAFGGGALAALLLTFPRRGVARGQLGRWRAALLAKSFASSKGCQGCPPH